MKIFASKRSGALPKEMRLQEARELHHLSQQVHFRRRNLNMTQEVLAGITRTTQSQIANIEAGHVNPTLNTIVRIAYALGCEVQDLFRPTEGQPEFDAIADHIRQLKELLGRASANKEAHISDAGENQNLEPSRSLLTAADQFGKPSLRREPTTVAFLTRRDKNDSDANIASNNDKMALSA